MPDMGGLALIKALKTQDLPAKVVVMTGYPLDEAAQRDLNLEETIWLSKPLIFSQLAQAISQTLSQ